MEREISLGDTIVKISCKALGILISILNAYLFLVSTQDTSQYENALQLASPVLTNDYTTSK